VRQEILAGLIVLAFGTPVAIIANGSELSRELSAVALAVRGNPAPLKQMLDGPKTDALPAPQVDVLDAILSSGAQALAEEETARRPVHHSVASQVRISHPVPMSKDDIFVLAGAELQVASSQLAGLGVAAAEVAKLDTGDKIQAPALQTHQAVRLAAAVADEFSIAANAEPAPRVPHGRRGGATVPLASTDGPWIDQLPLTPDEKAITADASRDDGTVVAATGDAAPTSDIVSGAGAMDGFQQIGTIDGGFTSAVPAQTSATGLTDIIAITR
jgi:hypothetical protein